LLLAGGYALAMVACSLLAKLCAGSKLNCIEVRKQHALFVLIGLLGEGAAYVSNAIKH
jgi:hypothetical protein